LHAHDVKAGDIWRSASARKAPIEDWVNLAIERQALTGYRSIFWLDENRAHDAQLIAMVKPILELGTSAKMLSIVKLMQGGGLFETGAGGSAPKHVQQLNKENHLRWDSLGEFCALGESFKFLGSVKNNPRAKVLGEAVEVATSGILDNNRSPERKVGQPDNRDSHYWFARYWAEALAAQTAEPELAAAIAPVAAELAANEEVILTELAAAQGSPADTGGYYHTDPVKTSAVMRPSATLNRIIG
jgi:isocitrate dehydrogenase